MAHVFTDANFEQEVKQSDKVTFVDFWAPWCGPCQMMGPIVDEIAHEMGDRVKVGKVNVDEFQEVAGQYDVMSIPAFFVFKNGHVVDQMVGGVQKEKLVEMIKKHL